MMLEPTTSVSSNSQIYYTFLTPYGSNVDPSGLVNFDAKHLLIKSDNNKLKGL